MISVYLDNCCYNRPFDDTDQIKVKLEAQAKMHIQELITEKRLELVYSFVSEYENSNNPNAFNRRHIEDFFKNASVYVDYSHRPEIKTEALEIMKTGIKEMDAMQVASAIIGKAEYFLTTDKRLLKYKTSKIILMNPMDFISIMEV